MQMDEGTAFVELASSGSSYKLALMWAAVICAQALFVQSVCGFAVCVRVRERENTLKFYFHCNSGTFLSGSFISWVSPGVLCCSLLKTFFPQVESFIQVQEKPVTFPLNVDFTQHSPQNKSSVAIFLYTWRNNK